jgi:transposase-like protein
MHAFYPTSMRISNPHRMDHEAQIQAAIADLESQDRINYAAIARKWEVNRSTLSRRYRGEIGPNQDVISYARRQLTDAQEKALIRYINKLSDRGIPPTP